ncbi:rhomboid family intramembrane serine protease, partial [Streptomyces sp. SID10244]|nr:rhomboid family intramembrane serine protease [Streptomyces sp. SID10244]
LPGNPGVSWQGHLFGALGGVLAAWFLADRDRRRKVKAGTPQFPGVSS